MGSAQSDCRFDMTTTIRKTAIDRTTRRTTKKVRDVTDLRRLFTSGAVIMSKAA